MFSTLIVADPCPLADRLEATLRLEWPIGRFQRVADGATAARRVNGDIGLVIVDRGIGSRDALDTLAEIRRRSTVPVLVVSDGSGCSDREDLLALGADEFVGRSFSPIELLARVKAVLGGYAAADDREPPSADTGYLALDIVGRRARVGDRTVRLTWPELRLMCCLIAAEGRVVPLRLLAARLWNDDENATAYLRVYMRRLREEIEADPDVPRILLTERGVGYRLVVPEMGSEAPISAPKGPDLVDRL